MGVEGWIESWLRDLDLVAGAPLPDGPRATTYNIGRGVRGRKGATHATLDRVAATIATDRPDVVGLQEVHEHDLPVLRRLLAREHGLGYEVAFGPALTLEGMGAVARRQQLRAAGSFDEAHYADRRSAYGVAVLSLAPIRQVLRHRLPGPGEPRVAVVAVTRMGRWPVRVVVTHVSTARVGAGRPGPLVRDVQTRRVLALAASHPAPVVVLADLNQDPPTLAANVEAAGVRDRLALVSDPDDPTLGGHTIDFVLASPSLPVVGRKVGHRGVSDHRPVTVAFAPDRRD